MPIFEYKCQKCGNCFEELVMGEKKVACPKCQSNSVQKLFSSFGVSGKSSAGHSCSQNCQGNCSSCQK